MESMMEKLNVSRETFELFKQYEKLLVKWNRKINLVSPSTLQDFWTRHIEDSIEVWNAVDFRNGLWLDLGSGGGLPGVVVAICARDLEDVRVVLVESDSRKCVFLRTVFRELKVNASVVTDRIENISPQSADVVSARALASLDVLLGFSKIHCKPGGVSVFPKGEKFGKEIVEAERNWRFEYDLHSSKTRKDSTILNIKNIERK